MSNSLAVPLAYKLETASAADQPCWTAAPRNPGEALVLSLEAQPGAEYRRSAGGDPGPDSQPRPADLERRERNRRLLDLIERWEREGDAGYDTGAVKRLEAEIRAARGK